MTYTHEAELDGLAKRIEDEGWRALGHATGMIASLLDDIANTESTIALAADAVAKLDANLAARILAERTKSRSLDDIRASIWDEAADTCERIQNDQEFGGDGPGAGVVTAKIVLRARAAEYRNTKEVGQ